MHSSRFVVLMASVAALGGLLFGYDTGVIAGAILFIGRDFGLSTQMQEITVGIVLIGAMLGAIAAGTGCDRFGRRKVLLVASVIFAVGAFASAFAPSLDVLLAGRIVVGLAIGLTSVTAPLYISEVSPRESRGALVSLYQLAITIGILGAQVVDYFLASSHDWQLMLGLAIVPSSLLFAGMLLMPESPRWLFAHGDTAAGAAVLARTHRPEDIATATNDIRETLLVHEGNFSDLFAPTVRGALFIGIALALLQQFTGINTVIYYGPQIFQLAGFSSDATAILATMGVGAINVLSTFIAIALIDRIGRKPLLYMGVGGMMLALFALAFAFSQHGLPGQGAITLVSLMVYVGCFAFSLGPIVWLLISEIYPLRLRGRGMAIATFANWLANLGVSLVFLTMIEDLGGPATFAIYGILCAITLVFIRVFVRETKSMELESISVQTVSVSASSSVTISSREGTR